MNMLRLKYASMAAVFSLLIISTSSAQTRLLVNHRNGLDPGNLMKVELEQYNDVKDTLEQVLRKLARKYSLEVEFREQVDGSQANVQPNDTQYQYIMNFVTLQKSGVMGCLFASGQAKSVKCASGRGMSMVYRPSGGEATSSYGSNFYTRGVELVVEQLDKPLGKEITKRRKSK